MLTPELQAKHDPQEWQNTVLRTKGTDTARGIMKVLRKYGFKSEPKDDFWKVFGCSFWLDMKTGEFLQLSFHVKSNDDGGFSIDTDDCLFDPLWNTKNTLQAVKENDCP